MKINLITLLLACLLIPGLVEAQSLESLLQRSVEANPELKELHLRYEAAKLQSKQVTQIPSPEIGIGVPILRPETRLGSQAFMVSARQMFPWFGALNSNSNIAISMAAEEYEKITATKLDLYYQVKEAYYKLYLLDEEQETLRESIRLFEALEQIAVVKLETGAISAADVLMIQIKLDVMRKEIQLKENMKMVYYSRINTITNSNLTAVVTITDTFGEVASVDFDFEELRLRLEKHHPLLRKIEAQIRTSEFKQQENLKSASPSLGVGLDYTLIHSRSDANPEFNGRDILVPKIMFSLPIYRQKYKSVNEEETLRQQLYSYEKEDLMNSLLSRLVSLKSEYDNAVLRIELVEEQIRKTDSAYEILLGEYSSNSKRIDELIVILDKLVEYTLEYKRAIVNSYLAKAGIERLTDF
ncbi:MAG: TolC family protein [Chitinophagales bacterium]|nr:TolC family protein [Chitinophagales bacterium]